MNEWIIDNFKKTFLMVRAGFILHILILESQLKQEGMVSETMLPPRRISQLRVQTALVFTQRVVHIIYIYIIQKERVSVPTTTTKKATLSLSLSLSYHH